MIYFYRRGAEVMDAAKAEQVMSELEASLRTGKFAYNSSLIYQSQIEGIKASWPKEHRSFMRGLVLKEGPEPGPATIRRAMDRTLAESVATSRSTLKGTSVGSEMKAISSDLCLSMIYRLAPDAGPSGGVRKYGGRTILTKTLGEYNPRRVIIKQNAGIADSIIFFLYNSELMRSWAVGWMSKDDVLALPCGNKTTNPEECSWSSMCYHGPVSAVRPMTDLLSSDGITELCEGVLMEQIPDMDEVPIKTRTQMEEYMVGREASAEEFWQVLGMKPPKPDEFRMCREDEA